MRRSGRAFGGFSGLLLPLATIYTFIELVSSRQYGVPVEIKVWDTGRSPLAHMVDVTNGFGLKVLAEHNFLNDNNIAFSPYGLMGIMVALYEGVDGESSYQIQRGMQLPWKRNVMRIGFRDIHRSLKTYFVPEEGFLAGLALNNENVTFNDDYKKILRFYGFDLENDQLPTLPTVNSSSENPTMSSTGSETTPTPTVPMSTEGMTDASTKEETTLNPNAETVDIDTRPPTETTTISPSSAPNAESTTVMTTVPALEATVPNTSPSTVSDSEPTITSNGQTTTTTLAPQESTTILISTASSSNTPTTPEPETTIAIVIAPSSEADAESVAQQTSQATSALTEEPTSVNEIVSSTVDMGSSTANSASDISTAMNEMITSLSEVTTETLDSTAGITTVTESSLETLQRRKKSIVDFIFTNPPYIDDYVFYRSYSIGPDIPGVGFDDQMFLANGLKNIQVTYMHYEAVLEHAFLPHLEASALRLPLDSDRYYLLVVLPNRGGPSQLGRMLSRMARESDLADIYAALRPRRVRATVPSFIVKGHVTLTTDLQKLGIRDVFEPRQRDFTLMTRQSGVYVRSIEQAVSVAIRKYRPDDHKKNRYVHNREPVSFHATYPFLYFVMDASIHVALMAGKMVDPLNSRIL